MNYIPNKVRKERNREIYRIFWEVENEYLQKY
jgi:hypothetical protein